MAVNKSAQSAFGLSQTIQQQLLLICWLVVMIILCPVLLILDTSWLVNFSTLVVSSLFTLLLAKQITSPIIKGIKALEIGLLNFKDGEFSNLLAYQQSDELGRLCYLYNQTAKKLRQEKQWIYQRELMLDKVLQSSPQALLLVDDNNIVVLSNYSARDLFQSQSALEGGKLNNILVNAPQELAQVITLGTQGLFQLEKIDDSMQTWHVATGKFLLNNRHHTLYIFKQLTRELNRQEVTVWKKVIRIISHELNNSLGPMSSMLHSGKILSKGLNEPRLSRVFSTLDERLTHLNDFVQGYGKFAKLPTPRLHLVDWQKLINTVKQHWYFSSDEQLPITAVFADQTQLEQLLINLLKNAHESGSLIIDIVVTIKAVDLGIIIMVQDSGSGMTETVINNALIPFYSTKISGSGIGLALCREIAEAHQGQLSLHNRQTIDAQPAGLLVKVFIPYQHREH